MEVCSHNFNDPQTVSIKVSETDCNLNCAYCYCSETKTEFKKNKFFDVNNFKQAISLLPKNTAIIFIGGEPTLIGKELLLNFINIIRENNFSIKPSILTNGYLADEWVDFFYENSDKLKLTVSIDGDEISNNFRISKDNNKVFNKVNDFIKSIDKKNIEFRCIATVNSISCFRAEHVMEHFSQYNNLKFLKLNPCYDTSEDQLKTFAIRPNEYLKFLKQCLQIWVKKRMYYKFELEPFSSILKDKDSSQNFEFKCPKFLSLYSNGDFFLCDTIKKQVDNKPIDIYEFNNNFQFEKFYPYYFKDEIDDCKKCNNIRICKGGCPEIKHRLRECGNEFIKEYCFYRKTIREITTNFIRYFKINDTK